MTHLYPQIRIPEFNRIRFNMEYSQELGLGQDAMEAGDYGNAIRHYTAAISASPSPECLYYVLNKRAAVYRACKLHNKAILDSKRAIALNVDDNEGYYGLALSHSALGQWIEVLNACKRGHEIEPNVNYFWSLWHEATNEVVEAGILTELVNPFGDTFQGRKMWMKLTCSSVDDYLEEDDFTSMMRDVQIDNYSLNKHMKDRRVLEAVSVLLNVNLRGFERTKKIETKEVPEEEEVLESKEKNGDQAKGCDEAMKYGREVGADFPGKRSAEMIEKATSVVKWAKSLEEFEQLVDILREALKRILEEISNIGKPLKQPEHYNSELNTEHLEKGNECFEQHLYWEALEHYAESLRRNQRNSKALWSRAECYIRLKEYTNALEEAEKFISLDPTNPDGYALKGVIQLYMEKEEEAVETFKEGLKYDPTNMKLRGGLQWFGTPKGSISSDNP